MAVNGVLRPGYIQLRVLDMDEALTHYVDRLGLLEVSREADGRVYLKGWDEFERHSVILRESDTPGMDMVGYKVAADADLDRYEQRLAEYGLTVEHIPAGEQPGAGRRISFVIPTGHRVELIAEMEMSDRAPQVVNPDVWPEDPKGMGATRFDHCLLYGDDLDGALEVFTQCLDFALAEQVKLNNGEILAIWLTCSNKAHDIAFVRHPEKNKFHHAAFFLNSWEEVGHAADIITRYDISLDIGPTRHGITRGQTIYFFDPSGNRNEVFAGGYTYYPDNPTREWSEDQLGKGIFYYERALNDRFLGVVT